MSTTLHCDSCEWSVTSEDEQDRVECAIYHALGVSHSVSEDNLLERYNELDAETAPSRTESGDGK